MKKKTYRNPGFSISISEKELALIRELICEYNVNISAVCRDALKKTHKKLKRENS
jgi:hypothetical protein